MVGTAPVLSTYELLLVPVFLTASLDPIVSPSLFEPNVVFEHGCSISAGPAFAIVLGHPGYKALGNRDADSG